MESLQNPNSIKSIMPSNDLSQKQPPSLLDRFRVLLKQKEQQARVYNDDDEVAGSSALSSEEIVQLYELLLDELTFNSKPIITDLTIIAGELRDHGDGIADAICARIVKVPVDQKLPSLYLLDSIVKNIGRHYVTHFSSRLPEVFCEAYRQVHPNLHPSMRHLFRTWSTVFPPSVLGKIENELQFSSQVNNNNRSSGFTSLKPSDAPRTTNVIHVNPKYVRLESSSSENKAQHVIGGSSSLKAFSQKPSVGYDRLTRRFSPSRIVADRPLPSEVDDFSVGDSPQRFVEGASPSHPVLDYGPRRPIGRDEETNKWRRKNYSDDNRSRFEASTAYSHSNGHDHQELRALIDAYGEDERNRIPNSKPLQMEGLDVDWRTSKVGTRSWQNTEEEEFDWEDMSPALVDHSRSNDPLPSVPAFRGAGAGPDFGKRAASNTTEDAMPPILGASRGGKIAGFETDRNQIIGSHYPLEALKMPHRLPQSTDLLNAKGRSRDFLMPYSGRTTSSSGNEILDPLVDKFPDANAQIVRPPPLQSRIVSSIAPSSAGVWPVVNVHKSHALPLHPIFPPQMQSRSQLDPSNVNNANLNQGLQKSSFMSEQQVDGLESKEQSLIKQLPVSSQHAALSQQTQAQMNPFQPHFLPPNENFPPSLASLPPHLLAPPFDHRYATQGPGASINSSNPVTSVQLPLPVNIPNVINLQVEARPPLPPGPPPASHMIHIPHISGAVASNQPAGSAFSGLINSLMSQGLISLQPTPVQDSVGLEFNADLLKVRHESAIGALYAALPRQCTTCGLRFKCQEQHSNHMDWHVTKNRMSKNRKQKPSRKWFVSASMWLSGAEALGSDAVPGFLPTEAVVEKKDDEEMAVPADEEQNACALCGEPFDDFYSDETEEWMYRGAVYLNAPSGLIAGIDRSQLGPIVHAKCRSDSSMVPSEVIRSNEGASSEDFSHRKRLRS